MPPYDIPKETFIMILKPKPRVKVISFYILFYLLFWWIAFYNSTNALLYILIGTLSFSTGLIIEFGRTIKIGTLVFSQDALLINSNKENIVLPFSDILLIEYDFIGGIKGTTVAQILSIRMKNSIIHKYFLEPRLTNEPILKRKDLLEKILSGIKKQDYKLIRYA